MGPLEGVKVIEFAGMGPAPHACMLLADLGANVLRVDRVSNVDSETEYPHVYTTLTRNRPSIAVDLKNPQGLDVVLRLCDDADILIEGYRPGVLERLGLGPDVLHSRNPSLVIGRVTGWGQTGPLAQAAGHDINYISLTGALACIGATDGPPVTPLHFVGDFGGGSMFLSVGVLAAYIHAKKTGTGQVVDAAMIDGSASLTSWLMGRVAAGGWDDERRGVNFVDGGSHYYSVYETADGKFISIGSIEPQFYRTLLGALGLAESDLYPQNDKEHWPENKARLAAIFKTRKRDEWAALLQHTDICFAPVLTASEAPRHSHNVERKTFVEVDGYMQPAPAPRFSATPGEIRHGATRPGQHTRSALLEFGFSEEDLRQLEMSGAIRQARTE